MRNSIFLISKAQRNFSKELFDSVEAQRNSAIAERHFRTKLKCNLTSAIEILQHSVRSSTFFSILDRKKVKNLLKKADIYQYYNQNRTKLSSMYRIALLTEKMSESAIKAQQILKTLGRNSVRLCHVYLVIVRLCFGYYVTVIANSCFSSLFAVSVSRLAK